LSRETETASVTRNQLHRHVGAESAALRL